MTLLSFHWMFYLLLSLQVMSLGPVTSNERTASPEKSNLHPFFVSVTEINHNAKDKAIEVSCKIFADDMEETLKKNYKVKIDLSDKKQQAQHDKLITDYITRHLTFSVDGKPVRMNYVGFEKESESVYCYFEVPQVATFKKLDVDNSILQDFTNQQINIMHVTINGNRKSYKLDFPNHQASFSF